MTATAEKKGRYRRELTTKTAQKSGENWLKKHAELSERLEKASPLPEGIARETLASSLADLLVQKQYFRELMSLGKLSSEESRAMSGMGSNIKRMLAELGLTGASLDGDESTAGGKGDDALL